MEVWHVIGRRDAREPGAQTQVKIPLDVALRLRPPVFSNVSGRLLSTVATFCWGFGRCPLRAVSTPTRVASGRAEVRGIAVIPLRARNRLNAP